MKKWLVIIFLIGLALGCTGCVGYVSPDPYYGGPYYYGPRYYYGYPYYRPYPYGPPYYYRRW